MTIIDWLLIQNPTLQRLTKIHLLNQSIPYQSDGYIGDYLALFDHKTNQWGGGVYSPKWISTHYTSMELMYYEMDPLDPIFQSALDTVLSHEWGNHGMYQKKVHVDQCVAAMLLNLSTYGRRNDPQINEIIDYLLDYSMPDGGWNCAWERHPKTIIGSVHTTLSVLEAFHQTLKNGYTYRRDELIIAMNRGVELLLSRELYKTKKTNLPIHPSMTKGTFPPRWKYDILRALEFLVTINYPKDSRMDDAINLLKTQMKGPFMPKGSQIPGLLHFQLESGRFGGFNTLRMLKVLKKYEPETYQNLIILDCVNS